MPGNRNFYEIKEFPEPFIKYTSRYNTGDFSDRTKDMCRKFKELSSNKSFKVIVLGDVGVGKTCLINRFCHQVFNGGYKATIGVDFEIETFTALETSFNLQIWDTAGQEKFKCIAQAYYRRAHAIILVFDMTSLRSMQNCKEWLKEALSAGNSNETIVFLVGNKTDLLSKATYQNMVEIGQVFGKSKNAEFWPVSSKSGENVKEMFFRLAALVFDFSFLQELNNRAEILIGINLLPTTHNLDKGKRNRKCNQCLINV